MESVFRGLGCLGGVDKVVLGLVESICLGSVGKEAVRDFMCL